MRIFVLGDDRPDLPAIIQALRLGHIEIVNSAAAQTAPIDDEERYRFAGWTLEAKTRDLVDRSGRRVELTSSEFDLLIAFLRRPGEPVPREDLMSGLKGRAWSYFDRSIDTLVARLRKKIDVAGAPSLLRSVRGVGYVFCAPVTRRSVPEH